MVTRAELKAEANKGPEPDNRKILYERAMTEAHAAIETAETAVADVLAAPDLATAQGSVAGVDATLADAKGELENVFTDLA